MIENITEKNFYGWDGENGGIISTQPPSNYDLMRKLNEVIDKVNELEQLLNANNE